MHNDSVTTNTDKKISRDHLYNEERTKNSESSSDKGEKAKEKLVAPIYGRT